MYKKYYIIQKYWEIPNFTYSIIEKYIWVSQSGCYYFNCRCYLIFSNFCSVEYFVKNFEVSKEQ